MNVITETDRLAASRTVQGVFAEADTVYLVVQVSGVYGDVIKVVAPGRSAVPPRIVSVSLIVARAIGRAYDSTVDGVVIHHDGEIAGDIIAAELSQVVYGVRGEMTYEYL